MKTIENPIPSEKTRYLADQLPDPVETLFFDIETTGLSPRGASIYLIGCAFYTTRGWRYRQYFADTPAQEKEILKAFLSFSGTFSHFIHFNGSTFDVPFLAAKCKKHGLAPFAPESQCDIYRLIRPYKNLLRLPGCRQKQLEEYVGLHREDRFNGGQLIELYKVYCEKEDEKLLQVLLLHNAEDLQGMLQVCAVLAVPALFEGGAFSVTSADLQPCRNAAGEEGMELLLQLSLQQALPAPLSCHSGPNMPRGCFFSGREKKAVLKVPVRRGELKYFYRDYKNYAYLPQEDQAIHKSVAVYVDKSRRMPATAATCYTRKSGDFLPWCGPEAENLPLFFEAHKAKEAYILPEPSFYADAQALHDYAARLLSRFK